MNLDNLREIISKKNIKPTINNVNSNFVVVTYWWGNKIKNQNTSRPCISFFEKLNNDVQKLCLKLLGTGRKTTDIQTIYKNLERSIVKIKDFNTIINKTATSYNEMIFEHLGLQGESGRDNKSIMKLEKMKSKDQTPREYEYKYKANAAEMFTLIMVEAIILTKSNMLSIFDINKKITELREKFLLNKEAVTPARKQSILKEIDQLNKKLTDQKTAIKKILNTKQQYANATMANATFAEFNNMSIYEILHKEFRFLSPMTYDEMIEKWERECAKHKCNHMAVEYSEFAMPGGYQMAINAKPLFIQKALAACGSRSVLYIDGDMFIRKYPKLFDLPDIDFMARGWLIDPRSSWKMEESITYDPYTFETSGGTMFFAQTAEAGQLINKWIEISSKSYQIGKADDRILSLVFNTYKFLCSMKIIQLPIEYLWLTLDYDDRLLDAIYDGDKHAMSESIMIEHSECLTSEDTATGSGAASDRTPKFYGYLEENVEPVSEQFHEYIMFPSSDMVETFKPYLEYMSGVQYLNDGNDLLVKKGFVHLDNPAANEQPLYITKYTDKFGNFKYPQAEDDKLTYNDVAKINTDRAKKMNIKTLGLVMHSNMVEINKFDQLMKEEAPEKYNHAKIISLIIKLLQEGKTVIYNPTTMAGYNPDLYELLLENEKTKYSRMEFIFAPDFIKGPTVSANYFYKPKIQTNQAMLFKPNEILIKFLMMFLSLDDLSSYLNGGSYEFMSRIRVGYVIKSTVKNSSSRSIGTNNIGENIISSNILKIDRDAPSIDLNKTITPPHKTITPQKTITPPHAGGGNNRDMQLYNEGLNMLYPTPRMKRSSKRKGGSLSRRRRTVKRRRTKHNKSKKIYNY